MTPRAAAALILASALAACGDAGDGPLPPSAAQGPARETRIAFQAVDAGTGGALADREMTVRWLVRAPITLDAAAVERVDAVAPYEIAQEVAADSLIVEVRVEAAAYHRLDTVLAVPRGGDGAPSTLRMTRRLERAAAAPTPTGSAPAGGVTRPAETAPAADAGGGASSWDRGALETGNRAYAAGNWLQAIRAYQGMQRPAGAGPDLRAYQEGLVRQGVSHMSLGEYAGALDALEEAVGLGVPSGAASLRLAQAQCAVGRVDEGRRTAASVEAMRLDASERPSALAVTRYVTALCGMGELDGAQTAIERVRVGGRLVQELQGFVDQASGVSPRTELLDAAVADAGRRIEEIRERMRRGG